MGVRVLLPNPSASGGSLGVIDRLSPLDRMQRLALRRYVELYVRSEQSNSEDGRQSAVDFWIWFTNE